MSSGQSLLAEAAAETAVSETAVGPVSDASQVGIGCVHSPVQS